MLLQLDTMIKEMQYMLESAKLLKYEISLKAKY